MIKGTPTNTPWVNRVRVDLLLTLAQAQPEDCLTPNKRETSAGTMSQREPKPDIGKAEIIRDPWSARGTSGDFISSGPFFDVACGHLVS